MTGIIFGISGQDGYYLSSIFQQHNLKLIGISRSGGSWLKGDVSNKIFVENLIKKTKPEFIFHLAANSTTRHDVIYENHAAIETGTINILEACYKYSKQSRIFLSGSAVQFANSGNPIDENTPFSPLSPYAVSRIASVYTGRYYRSLGLLVYVGYFFNHDSPLRTARHINQKIVLAVKRIAEGSNEKIEIGDVNVKKEFNYAEDVAKAIWILVQNDNVFETVIGSGKPYSIAEWLRICFTYFNKDWTHYVTINNSFKPEYSILYSNPEKIKTLGWAPETSIEELAKLMIEA